MIAPLLVGFGAGLSICSEYPTAPAAALVLLGWLLARRPRPRDLLLAAVGAAPPLLLLMHFQASAFGAVWRTPYGHLENPGFVADIAPGLMGISAPTLERLTGSLFAPYLGLFFWAPWTALALAALVVLWRRGPEDGAPGLVACAVVIYYLIFQITHSLWRSGWVIGPRYITPLVPLAAVAVGLALARLRRVDQPLGLGLLCGAGAAGIGATGLASALCQGFPTEVYNPLVETVAPLLSHGFISRNLLQLAGVRGVWSAVPYFAALALAIALLLSAPLRLDRTLPGRRAGALIALALAALLTTVQWTATSGDEPSHIGAARFFVSIWEPSPPPGARPF